MVICCFQVKHNAFALIALIGAQHVINNQKFKENDFLFWKFSILKDVIVKSILFRVNSRLRLRLLVYSPDSF